MQTLPLNESVGSRLSNSAAMILLLACAAGCGSSSSQTTGDGGPNDARSATGGARRDRGTGGTAAGGSALAVNLRSAGDYVILAKSGISTVPPSVITGNLGVSPMAATFITGFSLIADSTNVFSTSAQVTGKVYAADYAVPTPSNLTTAIGDMGWRSPTPRGARPTSPSSAPETSAG